MQLNFLPRKPEMRKTAVLVGVVLLLGALATLAAIQATASRPAHGVPAGPPPPPTSPPRPTPDPQATPRPMLTHEQVIAEFLKSEGITREQFEAMLWRYDPLSTKGGVLEIARQRIQLPPNAYVAAGGGIVECGSVYCPPGPVFLIQRGNSKVSLSFCTGEVVFEELAPGEEKAFDFLAGVRKPLGAGRPLTGGELFTFNLCNPRQA